MEYTRINKDELEEIIGMANIDPRLHKLGVNVKLHLHQPGKKKLSHSPRIKVFKKVIEDGFSITLNADPLKMKIIGEPFLKGVAFRKVLEGVKKYRIPFIKFWYDENMGVLELRDLMDKVDKGIDLKIED